MEAPRMTDDEARDLFSAYHDRELSPDDHERVRAHLAANPALAAEYDDFAAMLRGLSNLASPESPTPAPTPSPGAPVDLLAGVQTRLRKRSAGRFYADRWSRVAGIVPLEIAAALVLIGLVIAWVAMTTVTVSNAPDQTAPTAPAR